MYFIFTLIRKFTILTHVLLFSAFAANAQPANNLCENAADLTSLTGASGKAQVSEVYTNLDATVIKGDPVPNDASCYTLDDPIQAPVWFQFEGDGGSYFIRTMECEGAGDAYLEDTQMLIGTGGCANAFTEVACVEDIDAGDGVFEAGTQLNTEDGTVYYMLIDGYLGAMNEFCISFANSSVSVGTEAQVDLEIFPNPATDELRIAAEENIEEVEMLNIIGQRVIAKSAINAENTVLEVSSLPEGVYLLKLRISGARYVSRVSVE